MKKACPIRLGVNIDHVATLRQARGGAAPDPVWAAKTCEAAGADSIVMHLREDRRHVQDADLFRVKKALRVPLNLEMSVAREIVDVAGRLKPYQATLVPEKRQERTTEGGLDLVRNARRVRETVLCLMRKKIKASLFIDPVPAQIRAAKSLGADAVELHTGDYANRKGAAGRATELRKLRAAAALGRAIGLEVYAGHGLDLENVGPVASIDGIEELNIGFSIVTDALRTGLADAVRRMKKAIAR